MKIPLIAHIPHCSTFTPPDLRDSFSLSETELKREILRLTDWYVNELFASAQELGGAVVAYPISRLVLDPERFEDDDQEIMASRGMDVIYTRTLDGRELRATPSPLERQELLDKFYRPHQAAVEKATEICLDRFQKCLILDCHSFPSIPLPCDLDQDAVRPDVCLGTDPFHTPPSLTDSIEQFFHSLGWTVRVDKPYKGTYVPLKFYGKDKRVASIMIELNRRLYMDQETGTKLASFDGVRTILRAFVEEVSDDTFCDLT